MHKIFISFKKRDPETGGLTKDFAIAKQLRDYLWEHGYRDQVFFSEEELSKAGNSNFREAIDDALEEAKVLIFVSDNPSHLSSSWVAHEWGAFSNEIFSSRKRGEIYGWVTPRVDVNLIPITLRQYTILRHPSDYAMLLSYLESALSEKEESNVADWNRLKMKSHQEDLRFPYLRASLSEFIDTEFLMEEQKLFKVLYQDKNSFALCLRSKILACDEDERRMYYLDSTDELHAFGRYLSSGLKKEFELFIASVEDETDLRRLSEFIALYPRAKVLVGVHQNNKKLLSSSLLFDAPLYRFGQLTFEESMDFVEFFTKTTGYLVPRKLFYYVCSPHLGDLRSPLLLRTIFLSVAETADYLETDYNMTDVFDAIDHSLDDEVNQAIQGALSLMLQRRTRKIAKNELGMAWAKAEKSGLFLEMGNFVAFASETYVNYKIAELVFQQSGYQVQEEPFVFFKDALPYYIYLYEMEYENLVLLERCQDKDRLVLIDLFLSEEAVIRQLIHDPSFDALWIPFIRKSRHMGLMLTAQRAVDLLEKERRQSGDDFDYFSEKYLIAFLRSGDLLDLDYDQGRMTYYRAYVAYCRDDYERAIPLFDRAYQNMLLSGVADVSLLLDYCELLLDSGNGERLAEVVALLEGIPESEFESLEVEKFWRIKAIMQSDRLHFSEAISLLQNCIDHCLREGNEGYLQIYYGDIGNIKMYEGDYEAAIQYLQVNLKMSTRARNLNGMAISAKLLGKIHFLRQEFEEAYRYFSFSETYAQFSGNLWRLSKIRIYLHLLSASPDKVEEYEQIVNIIRSPVFLCDYELLTAFMLISDGEAERARLHFQKAHEYAGTTYSPRQIARTAYYLDHSYVQNESIKRYFADFETSAKALREGERIEAKPLDFFRYRRLKTKRLELRELNYGDAEDVFEYTSNPMNTRYVLWHKHRSLADSYAYIADQTDLSNVGYLYTWAIVLEGKVIGTIDLEYNEDYGAAEIGFILNLRYWHHGYAHEAAVAVLEFARGLGVKKVAAACFTANEASKKLIERLGFTFKRKIENYHSLPFPIDKSGLYFEKDLLAFCPN